MKTSDNINEIATALSLAQAEIKEAKLDSRNPHFQSDYASLSSVLKVRQTLSKFGMAITQLVHSDDKGFHVTTMLLHKSGQFLSSDLRLLIAKPDMQGMGSAITYARRYMIESLVGISEDKDDDGNSAVKSAPVQQQRPAQLNAAVPPRQVPNEALKAVQKATVRATAEGPLQGSRFDTGVTGQGL